MNDDTTNLHISPLTPEHAEALDGIDGLTKQAREHLAGWDRRESDSDPAAAAAMGQAIAAAKALLESVKQLHSGLVLEDAITAVEDDREAYAIRSKSDPNRMTGSV
ncbi:MULTISPECIES: hypothetical protein [Glycomyces]|uniref:Excreted virulence factor EspC, type VII ESX diderm n=2 Tax=Glycomyces TaxID=58113 RepID=A0ABU2AHV0_9ACTN|nr:hypothetical protein [Glycomyces lechevalierae]MDR7336776.1 hypothetical protein [Glycomyces lechevalierae]